MNKLLTATLLFLFFSFSALFAQSSYRPGYIVKVTNDTIRGEIKNRPNSQNYLSCVFRNSSGEKEYFPAEVKEFGYDGDKTFSTGITENSFTEILVAGEISLYRSPDKFHLKKDGDVHVLESKVKMVAVDGKTGEKETANWKGVLIYALSDCMPDAATKVSRIKLLEKSLVGIVKKYNECRGIIYTEYKSEKAWGKLDLGLSVGYNSSELKIDPRVWRVNYLADSYDATAVNGGIVMAFSSPRLNENLALQTEFLFSKSSYTSSISEGNVYPVYYDLSLDFTTLSIPVSVKYTIPKNSFGYFFQGGLNYDHNIQSQLSLRTVETNIDASTTTTVDDQPFFLDNGYFGYWAGLGFMKSFKRIDTSLSLRYFNMTSAKGSSNPEQISYDASRSQFALNLIIGINENTF